MNENDLQSSFPARRRGKVVQWSPMPMRQTQVVGMEETQF